MNSFLSELRQVRVREILLWMSHWPLILRNGVATESVLRGEDCDWGAPPPVKGPLTNTVLRYLLQAVLAFVCPALHPKSDTILLQRTRDFFLISDSCKGSF